MSIRAATNYLIAAFPRFIASLAMVLSAGQSLAKTGGSMDGGGGGDLNDWTTGSAWFLGEDKPIKSCIDASPEFTQSIGKSSSDIRGIIATAMGTWHDYLLQRGALAFSGPEWHPSMTLSWADSCGEDTELRFLFGINNDAIAKARALYLAPASFSTRESYDAAKGRGKGFIWVANPADLRLDAYPDLRLQKNFEILITHELGHVLGTGHVNGTIMAADILRTIKNMGTTNGQQVGIAHFGIDFFHELIPCDECKLSYRGSFSGSDALFAAIFGRAPQGTRHATVGPRDFAPYVLQVKDDLGELNCAIAFPNATKILTSMETPVLKLSRLDLERGQPVSIVSQRAASVDHGYFHCPGQADMPVVIERNTDGYLLKISRIGFTLDSVFTAFFTADWD